MISILKKGATKAEMEIIYTQLKINKGVNTKKYCGAVKLEKDPLEIQKQMRDEWR